VGTTVAYGEPLLTIHAETPGELDYARTYLGANSQMIGLEDAHVGGGAHPSGRH
jgi:thymidine phosphorylase